MPKGFKPLATIAVWVLWIVGMVMGFSAFINGLINRSLYGSEPPPVVFPIVFAVALAYIIGAVVIMRLRQKME